MVPFELGKFKESGRVTKDTVILFVRSPQDWQFYEQINHKYNLYDRGKTQNKPRVYL